MVGKHLPQEPSPSEQLAILIERGQSLSSILPSGRIELVGTTLGSLAVGIFPNYGDLVADVLLINNDAVLVEEHHAHSDGSPYGNLSKKFTATAVIGGGLNGPGGLEEFPIASNELRIEKNHLTSILRRVSGAGSSYDPFQSTSSRPMILAMIDAGHNFHPSVLEASASLRD